MALLVHPTCPTRTFKLSFRVSQISFLFCAVRFLAFVSACVALLGFLRVALLGFLRVLRCWVSPCCVAGVFPCCVSGVSPCCVAGVSACVTFLGFLAFRFCACCVCCGCVGFSLSCVYVFVLQGTVQLLHRGLRTRVQFSGSAWISADQRGSVQMSADQCGSARISSDQFRPVRTSADQCVNGGLGRASFNNLCSIREMKGARGNRAKEKVSPTVTRSSSSRKHFLNHFVKEAKLGCVRRSSMAEIRREFQLRSTTVVRPLGPRVAELGSQGSLHSEQTYFVEGNPDETELSVLQANLRRQVDFSRTKSASISKLEAHVSTLTEQVGVLTKQVAVLMKEKADRVYSLADNERFTTVGMRLSVRTFMDHIVSAVYTAAGVSEMTDADMAAWLRSGEATSFFKAGRSITLFNVETALDPAFLGVVRGFKSDSSAISRQYAHSTNPVRVATALSNLLFNDSDDVVRLFKSLFQYSCGELANRYEADLLTKDETGRLVKNFSSRY